MIFPVSALPVLSHFLHPQSFSSLSHLLCTFLPLIFKSHPKTPLSLWGFPWLRQEEAVTEGTPFCTVTNTGTIWNMQSRNSVFHQPAKLPILRWRDNILGEAWAALRHWFHTNALVFTLRLSSKTPKAHCKYLAHFSQLLFETGCQQTSLLLDGSWRWQNFGGSGAAPRERAGQKICTQHSQSKPYTWQKLHRNAISQGTVQNSF